MSTYKNLKRKKTACLVGCLFGVSQMAFAEEANDPAPAAAVAQAETIELDAISVTSILPDNLESVPGSIAIVDEEELEERRPFSIKEAINQVPGVHIVGEDSFGLGLNIGVRGLDPRRSARTLLLEDGMPLFLAPYGDPAAHYSTPLERVQRIEVVKGSGQVLYGPQSVGGMINFVTRPVPTEFAGSASVSAGNNDFQSYHGNVGTGGEWGGIMIDALQKKGDGVRDNHDFEINEVMLKSQFNLTDRQTLIAKVGYYEEDSHISETGLGLLEYNEDKFQAPTGGTDFFEQDRKTAHLNHLFQFDEDLKLSTQAYYVDTFRQSYRQINDDADDEDGGILGRSRLSNCPAGVDITNLNNAGQCGGQLRPRSYIYYGFEQRLDFNHDMFGVPSAAVVGYRYHREDIKRRKFESEMPGNDSATIANGVVDEDIGNEVKALSYYAQNTFFVGDWTVTPGLRIEDVENHRTFKVAEGDVITGNPNFSEKETVLLPGLGVSWFGLPNTTVFAGIHKGFAPPRPDRDVETDGAGNVLTNNTSAEESINTEIGVRSNAFKGVAFETTLFNIDFDNLVVNAGNGTFENAGKSQHTGIEFAGRVDFGTIYNTPHNFYVSGSYTNLFIAKFKKDGIDPDDGIMSGSRLPYAPRQLASVSFGYEHPLGFDARFGVDYVSEQKPDAGNRNADPLTGLSGEIPAYTLLNISLNYKPIGSNATFFLSGYNLADREFLVSRVDGMVAGRQRQVFGGVRYDF